LPTLILTALPPDVAMSPPRKRNESEGKGWVAKRVLKNFPHSLKYQN
jgi:hypothetical protein